MRKILLGVCFLTAVIFLTGCQNKMDIGGKENGGKENIGEKNDEKKTENIDPEVILGKEFILKVNTSVIIKSEQLEVYFKEVVSDSRCPSDVLCVWSGEATVRITVKKRDDNLGDFSLSTIPDKDGQRVLSADGYQIYLMKVEPENKVNQTIRKDDYKITLRVEKTI